MRKISGLILLGLLLVVLTGCAQVVPAAAPASTPPPPPTTSSPAISPSNTPITINEIKFSNTGYTDYGNWSSDTVVSPSFWRPGAAVSVNTTLRVTDSHMTSLVDAGFKADGFVLLVTAERTFDSDGNLRLASDERMSTLVTLTGLAIEGGIQGAVTNRFGYEFRTPADELVTMPLSKVQRQGSDYVAIFNLAPKLPLELPPGIYRLRLDYGITIKGRYLNLNGDTFARRPFFKGRPTESHLYSPPIRASGAHVNGRKVDALSIQPRIPWMILANYNSNGYRGVVADEDETNFALSPRNLIPDDVILPLFDDSNKNKLAYNLEPQFPADTIEARSNIPWDFTKGELSILVTGPDNKTVDLGKASFVTKAGDYPTTKNLVFTAWKPPAYGYYTVKATGWLADIWGNRYAGGGTYHFWIAKRMTLATATFQGMAYPVGSRYGRDIGFAPAVPADVMVDAQLYVNSDPKDVRTISYSGKASPAGIFGAAQGMKPFPLDAPGEYHAHILAKYTDQEGHFWVSTMRHAGVVYAEDSPIVARGKKLNVNGKLVERGETKLEGYIDVATDTPHLQHINYPFQSGDELLIASDHQGANKIEPVLTYENKTNPTPYDSRLSTIGTTNLKLRTSNGYSPHLFPEYITDRAYYYAGAPRPGFMSRFIVAEDGTRAPYWPTSPNNFGGQINASNNGDLPGDIYRLIGGVVLKKKGEAPAYAGYLSSAFILEKGSNNNRIIAAGSEDLTGSDGTRARLFLVGTRPGMVYETGTSFAPAVQIDPVLPANVTFMLEYPDERQVVAKGQGDKFGTFVGKDRWLLDIPGIYRFTLEAEWQGYKGYMPGLPKMGGYIYVIDKDKPQGATGLKLNLPEQSSFALPNGLTVTGTSTAGTGDSIHYAAVIPGAVIAEGDVSVRNGKFEYKFDLVAINKAVPTYDITNLVNGKAEVKDVVHLTFFSRERTAQGTYYYSFARLILRGTTVIYAY